jgi:hypothetical protein
MRLLAPVLLSTLLSSTISAMTFSAFRGIDCSFDHGADGLMRSGKISAQDGCHKRKTDDLLFIEKSLRVELEDGNLRDQSNFMVFFKDEECDPTQVLGQSDYNCTNEVGAADWNSFEVWDMCEDNPMCDFGVGPPASEILALAEASEDNTPQGGTFGTTPNPDAETAEDDTPQGGVFHKVSNSDAQTATATASSNAQPALATASSNAQSATATASSAEDNTPQGGVFHKVPNPDTQTATATASSHAQPSSATASSHAQPATATVSSHAQPATATASSHAQPATAAASSADDNAPQGGVFHKVPNPDAQRATATASAE